MKTNIPIELDDTQRNALANLVDGKISKRLLSRKEVVSLASQHFGGLLSMASGSAHPVDSVSFGQPPRSGSSLDVPDTEDAHILADKPPSYIRGWNQVKRGSLSQS